MDVVTLVALVLMLLLAAGLVVALSFARARAAASAAEAAIAEQRIALLEPYAVIPNAQAEAVRISQAAQASAQQTIASASATAQQTVATASAQAAAITTEANELLVTKQAESVNLITAASAKAAVMTAEANEQFARKQTESITIIASAEVEAERIAGDALRARDKADDYRRAARAMKNIIEGYGEEVWIPGASLLDDLAEGFDYKEAGQKLKAARELTRSLLKAERASDCDYKEKTRRNTAMRFIADAFTGKVDSILSKLKHDNYGKLAARIDDAFALVNLNGQAFRNARITDDYLAARKDELNWGVRAMELQRIEREEQRRIKEQLREEERARKEYERAVKAAEKEEKMLHKAMQSAEKHLEEASAAHRAKYEAELEQLRGKLAQAEAKGERALSMAQQTKRGHVYIISNIGSFGDDVYKIGLTRRLEPTDRVKELGDASVPFEFDIHAMIRAEDAPALEAELHRRFVGAQVNRVNRRKEFFRVPVAEIRTVVAEMGVECQWTMVAEAREYRESLALVSAKNTGAGVRMRQTAEAAVGGDVRIGNASA